jgi:hypothetical protein
MMTHMKKNDEEVGNSETNNYQKNLKQICDECSVRNSAFLPLRASLPKYLLRVIGWGTEDTRQPRGAESSGPRKRCISTHRCMVFS